MSKGKKMLRSILIVIIVLICAWRYFRYFELKSIYFPEKKIEYNPEHMQLAYEDIFFKTQDGQLLNGWFVPSDNFEEKSKPTIIFCHGNAGNIGDRLESIQIFYDLGLNVFIFDYRGYGRSKGHLSEQGTYLDARAAYNYIISRTDIDKDKIIMYGESLGAAVTIELATEQDLKLKAIITYGGFSSTQDMARAIYPVLPLWLMVSIKYDSISKIKDIKIPKLIIHGTHDEIVPFKQGYILFDVAAEPKEFLAIEGGHNDAVLINREKFLEKIKNFLAEHNI